MLTQRMQIQAIADLTAGIARPSLRPRDFQEPWKTAYVALSSNGHQAATVTLREAFASNPDSGTIIAEILRLSPGQGMRRFLSLAEMDLPPIEWLWEGWIARGVITALAAAPGTGKSYVALDLARRVLAGEAWPDGLPLPGDLGGTVVYVDAENVPQIHKERSERWGMDLRRLYMMLPEIDRPIDFGDQESRDTLIEMMHATGAGFVVVDSLSMINTRGENNVEDVRGILGFLNQVAQEFRCGLVLIHHLKKRQQLPLQSELTQDDLRGSTQIQAMARTVLGLSLVQTGPETDRNGPRKMEVLKSNIARIPAPLGCEFVDLHPRGVYLKWTKEAPKAFQEPSKNELCQEWLAQFLRDSGEPVSPADVVKAADEAGFSRRTVYRAREALEGRILNTEGRQHPDNCWMLAPQTGEEAD
jgi:putative DNA primase/helicase